ncbi:MAG: hypothetical protein WCA31_09550 [Acidimicrobiales bacterium]
MTARWRSPRTIAVACLLLAVIAAGVALAVHEGGTAATATTTTSTSTPATEPPSTKPLSAPSVSVAADGLFLTDVTEVDPALVAYEKSEGNVALRSLLTDGSAFCALLERDHDIDGAMVSVAVGARQVESTTHLPLSVTTFNAVEAVAILTLCPSLEKFVPPSDMTKIRALGNSLTGSSG